jgi:site-specific DNA recombinase
MASNARDVVMEKRQRGAVIYVRVSTDEQAHGPLNLVNQENRCRTYCRQNGLSVAGVFTDPGESARSTDRPEFQRMLAFCKSHRRDVGFVVIQDLSRLARNMQDQAQTINELGTLGVRVRSTYESNIDETAAGRLAANIYGTFNQYFSDALSEKMRDRARESVAAGRFPWPAPIGYLNVEAKSGPNIVPDPERAPLILKAFQLIANGPHSRAAVLKIVTELGLRTRRNGRPLSPQTFHAMLQKPVYCGWITPPSMEDLRVKGLHEPIVTQELFDRVQQVLSGKKSTVAARKRHNPDLPLKWFVKCEACRTPLTGGFSTGKNKARKYGHYWCRKKECHAVMVAKEMLESEFVVLLCRLRPDRQTIAAFPKIAAKVWERRQGDAEASVKRLRARLEDAKKLKTELLKAKLRGEVPQPDYEQANAEYGDQIAALEGQLQLIQSSKETLERFVRFAELMLVDIAGAWREAGAEQRVGVQNLLFEDGLLYSKRSGFLNTSKPSLFSVLEEISTEQDMLASPTGFEPVLPP